MVIPDGWAQANMIFEGDAAPTGAEVTFGLDVTDYTHDPLQAATDVFAAWTAADIKVLYVGALTLQEVRVKFGPTSTGPFASITPAEVGEAANPATSVNTALLVSKFTGHGGRSGRGRFYLPGLPDNQVDADGTIHSGFLDTAFGNFSNLLEELSTALLPMALLHGADTAVGEPYPVTALVPQAKAATQRRRLRR